VWTPALRLALFCSPPPSIVLTSVDKARSYWIRAHVFGFDTEFLIAANNVIERLTLPYAAVPMSYLVDSIP